MKPIKYYLEQQNKVNELYKLKYPHTKERNINNIIFSLNSEVAELTIALGLTHKPQESRERVVEEFVDVFMFLCEWGDLNKKGLMINKRKKIALEESLEKNILLLIFYATIDNFEIFFETFFSIKEKLEISDEEFDTQFDKTIQKNLERFK